MPDLLPIIDQLANARDHGERVEWLLQCPFGILGKYDFTIRNRLQLTGFEAGLVYLDAIGVMRNSIRSASGELRPETAAILAAAVQLMVEAVHAVDAADRAVS